MKTIAAFVVALVLALSAAGAGLTLDEAKRRGMVGEQYDGYLGAVNAPTAEVAALVDEINRKRRAEYRRIANANNISIDDVEALAGKKAIERTSSGFVKGPDGRWRRR